LPTCCVEKSNPRNKLSSPSFSIVTILHLTSLTHQKNNSCHNLAKCLCHLFLVLFFNWSEKSSFVSTWATLHTHSCTHSLPVVIIASAWNMRACVNVCVCVCVCVCVRATNANALIWSKMKTESERQKGLKSSSWYTNNFKMPFNLRTSFWCVIGKKWVGLKHIVFREKELRKIVLKTDVMMTFWSHP
jgi:hypothetical protein